MSAHDFITLNTARITINPAIPASLTVGRIDPVRVDATTEADITAQQTADEMDALQDAA